MVEMGAGADTWQNIGGQAYCFGRMVSQNSIVLGQKTIVFQSIEATAIPPPPKYPPLDRSHPSLYSVA